MEQGQTHGLSLLLVHPPETLAFAVLISPVIAPSPPLR